MNHQTAKILLLIIGAIFTAFNMAGSFSPEPSTYEYNDNEYRYEIEPESNFDIDYERY